MYLLLWARHCSFSNWGMAALKYCISFSCTTKSMSYMYPYTPSLANLPPQTPIPTIQVITAHRVELPALYSRFPLAAYCFTPGREHTSISASQFTRSTLPVSTLVFSTLCLYRCCFISKLCLTLQPRGRQHTRLLCSPLFPGLFSNSCPLRQWFYLTVSSSAAPSPFCLQSLQSLA